MRASPPTPAAPVPAQRPAAVQLRARRGTRLMVLGVLCCCVGSLGMAWAWTSAQDSQTVVLMAASVSRGEQIEASDLTSTTLGRAQGVSVLPVDQASTLVGQFARIDLPAGSLPGSTSVGPQVVPPGTAHVGLRLSAGRLPAQSLPSGCRISLVAVPSAMDNDRSAGAQYEAWVVAPPVPTTDGSGWLIDVQVDEASAAAVAALASAERIAVVRRADG